MISENAILPENSSQIQERFVKAVSYFLMETKANIQKPIHQISFSTDNKTVKTDFEKQFNTLQEKLEEKLFALEKMTTGFQVKKYLEVRANAVLQKTEPSKKKTVSSKRDPILALKLRELRDEIRIAQNIPAFQIFTQETLYLMCDLLPRTEKELLKVSGMGKVRVEKYGQEILEVINEYCEENGIHQSKSLQEKPLKEVKKNTKQISLEMFRAGMSVKEIAKERNYTTSTIESHLASYIPSGEVDILELLSLKKYKEILKAIEKVEFKNLTELKEQVDDSFTYAELRLVLLTLEK